MTDTTETKTVTVGVKPAFYLGIIAALLASLATQTLVDLPSWADLLVLLGSVGVGTALAGPGTVVEKPAS